MRDEIHLTRILIQYYDTEDAQVLAELKEWFANMNEVQRTVMAEYIRDKYAHFRNIKMLEPYKKIYAAIKQYDTADKSEDTKEDIKEAGL